jgi:hypothetical protein
MAAMPTGPSPEICEVDSRGRTWSLGSQLLGHYDTSRSRSPGSAVSVQYVPYASSGTGFDIYSGAGQMQRGGNSISGGSRQSLDQLPGSTTQAGDDATSQTQRPLLRASTTFYDRISTDWWWWELFSWLVSFLCAAAIVGVLAFYDGKKQPDFVVPGITLNAFVSVFAAVSKAALILPVSEAIGQLKWIWFHQDRKLWDFYTFDGASRGPWGAVMLLWTTKGRSVSFPV